MADEYATSSDTITLYAAVPRCAGDIDYGNAYGDNVFMPEHDALPYHAWQILFDLRSRDYGDTIACEEEICAHNPWKPVTIRRALKVLVAGGYLLATEVPRHAYEPFLDGLTPQSRTTRPRSPGVSKQTRLAVWEKTQGRCWYCGNELRRTWDFVSDPYCTDHFVIDHVVPTSAGGTSELVNLVPACRQCNTLKGQRSLEEFRARQARHGLPVFTPAHLDYLRQLGIALPADFPCYPTVTFWFEAQGLTSTSQEVH
jgi:5-methylcytosine-specific restriction endonuclease McrA